MARHTGRHELPAERVTVPWELVGWGAFACLVAAAAVVWLDGSWATALLVVAAGVLGLGAVTVMVLSGSRPPRRPPPP